ncbi:MAG: Na+/H+ antiporter subunit E [Cyanobacteria bacterium J06656_5]
MIRYLDLLLRLTIWFLITADGSLPNILIGVAVALLLPWRYHRKGPTMLPEILKEWLHVLWEIVQAIPQAYIEAIEIMVRPHRHEAIVHERVRPYRTPGLIFLDIFLITFTPKTIVVRCNDEDGRYDVHRIQRRRK